MSDMRVKLAEQALAAHKAKLRTAGPERDQVRRQIAAAESRLELERSRLQD